MRERTLSNITSVVEAQASHLVYTPLYKFPPRSFLREIKRAGRANMTTGTPLEVAGRATMHTGTHHTVTPERTG